MLVLGGAGIRSGTPDVPAGVVDIAPTILALLGLPPLPEADGRALTESFTDGPAPESVAVQTETLATLPERCAPAPLYRRHDCLCGYERVSSTGELRRRGAIAGASHRLEGAMRLRR